MDKLIIDNYIKVSQPLSDIYVFSIDGKQLAELSEADLMRLDSEKVDYTGFQRDLEAKRVNEITKYIDYVDATFASGIVLATDSAYVSIDAENKKLSFIKSKSTFEILDGQHRIKAFKGSEESFDLIVSLFVDLDDNKKAEIFKTINFEHKSVNPSYAFELEKYSPVKTPEKIVREIAYAFLINQDSPFYQKIKMLGKKDEISPEGILSLKYFADPLLPMIYDVKDKYKLRTMLIEYQRENNSPVHFNIKGTIDFSQVRINMKRFGAFYVLDAEHVIYKILLNYFRAFRNIMPNSWNKNGILLKTAGYVAMMNLLNIKYDYLYEQNMFSEEKLTIYLKPLAELDGKITSDNYGTGGGVPEKAILDEFLKRLG